MQVAKCYQWSKWITLNLIKINIKWLMWKKYKVLGIQINLAAKVSYVSNKL